MFEIVRYLPSEGGRSPYQKWFDALADGVARALVTARVNRLASGHHGDSRPVGEGVWELRIDHGPGYRVYYVRAGRQLVVLLAGGDKRTQRRDIEAAIARWREFRARKQ